MADQDLLLPRRAFAVLPPVPGGFEDALARGRRRRRRNTGGGVLASVIALALAVSLTGSDPDADANLFVKQPETGIAQDVTVPAPGDAEDVAQVTADETDDDTRPDTVGSSAGDRSTTASGSTGDSRTATAPVAEPRDRAPRVPAAARGRRLDPPQETEVRDGYVPCKASDQRTVVLDWCLQATYAIPDETVSDAKLSIAVCRAPQTEARELNFHSEQQVDYTVTRLGSDEILWQWSHRAVFGEDPTKDPLASAACRVYSVVWKGLTDNDENFVGAGDYVLTARSLATELGPTDSASVPFTI